MHPITRTLLKKHDIGYILQETQSILANEAEMRATFYEWVDSSMKAEFINGEIVVHSPALHIHTVIRTHLSRLADCYVTKHSLGIVCDEKAMIHCLRNSYEPDICFWENEKAAAIHDQTSIYPVPDWIVEILSKSTKKRDRGIKFQDYAGHKVAEYWIIDPETSVIEQYHLAAPQDTIYTLLATYTEKDTIQSLAIKGFTIPVAAIFDKNENWKTLAALGNEEELA